MKKMLSLSLAAALMLSAVPAAFAETTNKGDATTSVSQKNVDKAKKDNKGGQKSTTESTDDDSETDATVDASAGSATKADVQKAVKTKKELIELRQQLKKATEVTEEMKNTYEELIKSLEDVSDLKQAIEVQKELLERTYKAGDRKLFHKLGELYKKSGEDEVKAFVNGVEPFFDEKPFIQGGRALVPVRAISASLKADVNWDSVTRTAVITKGENEITLYVDKKEALVNGKTIALDIVPVIKNGRVFLPLRFVSEQLKAKVDWQQEGKIVIIEDPQAAEPTDAADKVNENKTTSTE